MENYYFKHPSHFGDMFGIFEDFYRNKTLSDVIINCQGRNIHAHRMVLCAGSDHFRRVLTTIKAHNHLPVLIINDISFEDMEIILEFIYRGQIVVSRDKVESLRQAAYKLRIKGFENFLRKPFCGNGGLGSFGSNSIKTMSNGNMRGMSLLNDNKRYLQHMNEMEIKKLKMFHSSSPNGSSQDHLVYNRYNKDSEFKKHAAQSSPQLEAALQRGLNGGGQSNSIMKKMINIDQLMMKQRNGSNGVAGYDNNGTLDLKVDKQNDQINSVTITPINGEPNSSPAEHSGNSSVSDSCDENEDNQKNENTENAIINGQKNLNHYETNSGGMKLDNGNGLNSSNDKDEYDSEDSQQVSYTYEMDPSSLAHQWDASDENINQYSGKEDADGMEEEDYFESIVRHSNSMFDSMTMANVAQKLNGFHGGQQNFYYCEHCPKYFFDEDHLQLHIKRTHGLNKLNQCHICGKAYAWKSGLYKHKRHVHNIGGTNNKHGLTVANDDMPESPVNSQPPTPVQSSMEALKVANNATAAAAATA